MSNSRARRTPCTAQPPGELDVLLLDGDSLGVDGAEVRVVKKVDKEGFSCLLQRHEGLTLPSERIAALGQVQCNFSDLRRLAPCEVDGEERGRTTRWNGSFRSSSSVDF
jgi:hypothetical protein